MSTQSPLRLIVGLGNPGTKYQATRHNVGFWQVDHYAQDLKTSFNIEKTFFGGVAKAKFDNQNIYLLKPTTYMNRSGLSIQAVANFYKITPAEILVVHDELDLLPGQVKLKFGGSHAGHNGLKDTIAALGSQDFWRLRIGIGHPRTLQLSQSVADFVLHPPRREDQQLIDDVVLDCRRILPHFLSGDIRLAQQELGRR